LPEGARLRLGTERFRPGGGGRNPIAIFPSGEYIVSVGDHYLTLFDAERGNVVKRRRFKDKVIEDLAVSPDGKRIVTVGYKQIGDGAPYFGDVTVWDSLALVELKTIPGEERTYFVQVIVLPGSKVAATVDRRGVSLWDLEGNRELPNLPLVQVRTLTASPDGSVIAVVDSDGAIRLWEWRTKNEPRKIATRSSRAAAALAFSPDGKTLAVGVDYGDGVTFWDVETGKRLRSLPSDSTINLTSMTFTRDGKHLITPDRASIVDRVGMGGVHIWDVATGKEVRFLATPGAGPHRVSLSGDGSRLAVASSGNIRVWDTRNWQELAADDTSHRADVLGIAISKNGLILTGSDDSSVRLWDLKDGRLIHKFPCHFWIRYVALTPDGSRAAALDTGGDTLIVWDTATGKTVYRLPGHKYNGHHDICISGDGKRLLSFGGDLFLRVTDLTNGKAIAEHAIRPQGVAIGDTEAERPISFVGRRQFTPDGKHILLEVGQGCRIIDTSSGNEVRRMGGSSLGPTTISPDSQLALFCQHSPSLDPNGKIISYAKEETVRIVKIENDEAVASMIFKDGGIRALACSPDGTHFAVAVDKPERALHLCAIGDDKPFKTFKLTTRATPALAFSPDGKSLAVGVTGGSVLVFDVPVGKNK
jgi:WD40 repeat protein